jgi:hypothetical protein
MGVHNSRGAHFRLPGGDEERIIASKYRASSKKLAFEYPFVSNLLEQIAAEYDSQAVWMDSEDAVRRKLEH